MMPQMEIQNSTSIVSCVEFVFTFSMCIYWLKVNHLSKEITYHLLNLNP